MKVAPSSALARIQRELVNASRGQRADHYPDAYANRAALPRAISPSL